MQLFLKGMIGVEEVNVNTLHDNSFYLFYEMMLKALKTNDVIEGINNSLYLLKVYLNCGDIVLHVKDEANMFTHYVHQSGMINKISPISCIVNKTANITRCKGILDLHLDLSENFRDMKLMHLKTTEREYILSMNNVDSNEKLNDEFYIKLKETMEIILSRAEIHEKNIKAVVIDLLTGLDNRNSYETRVQNMDERNENLVFGIFDLFRLKYINDNYSHAVGDLYIKEVAKILKRYWPKEKILLDDDGVKHTSVTGHCVYRVGGDEFILLTNTEGIELTRIKAKLAAEEVSMLDLGIDELPVIGINYGIVSHNLEESIKETYEAADKVMSEDKKKMYGKFGLERRRA